MNRNELTEQDRELIISTLNTLGAALNQHDHLWSNDERRAYERAMRILESPRNISATTSS